MLRYSFLLSFFFMLATLAFGQDVQDSLLPKTDSVAVPPKKDSVIPHHRVDSLSSIKKTIPQTDSLAVAEVPTDSISKKPWQFSIPAVDTMMATPLQLLKKHPYFNFEAKPVIVHPEVRTFKGKEVLFYVLIVFLLIFSLLRQAFPKYFNDLFRLLFRTTLKQKQLREQLMQTPLPSFLLNVFFVLSGGLYIDLLLNYFEKAPIADFWLLFLYCSVALSVIYVVKFAGLNITGWLFNIKGAADIYVFIVFMINKVIGIFLLPFLVLLSFTQGNAYTIALAVSWCGVGVFFIYRYFLTYTSVRNQVKFNPFHFFLYLCAFEIAPLLLIYKGLLFFFHQN